MHRTTLKKSPNSNRCCLPIWVSLVALSLVYGCDQPTPPPSSDDAPPQRTLEEPSVPTAITTEPPVTSPELEALESRLDAVTEEVSKSPERRAHGLNIPARFEAEADSPLHLKHVWMSVNVDWCNDGCVNGPAETPINDDDLKLLLPFARTLLMLDLQRTEITDTGVQTLSALTSLETLKLAGTRINGSGLIYLATMNRLKHLDLSETQLEPDHLQALTTLPSLQTVLLPHAAITDDVLASVGKLRQLQSLNLAKSPISDHGLAGIAELKRLETLDLSGTEITDSGLAHLSALTNLRELRLSQTKIQGTGLSYLAKLSRLTDLDLAETLVNDAGLSHLSGLRQLQTLELSHTRVQGYGLAHLKNCQLHSAKFPPVSVSAVPAINAVKSWHSLNLKLVQKENLPIQEPLPAITLNDMPELKRLSIATEGSMDAVTVENCPQLESFGLQHDLILRPGASLHFENLPSLQHLHLNGAFRELSGTAAFSQITRFHLHGVPTSDVVRTIGRFSSLMSVDLKIVDVAGDQIPMDQFAELPDMQSAEVQLQSANASWLVRLIGRMPALQKLNLRGQSLSGEQLAPLSNCRKLTMLSIHGVDDPGEPLKFLEAMPEIDQCLILGCPHIGRIRLTKKTGVRRFYFKYGQLNELEVDGAPNLTAVNLAHEVHGYNDIDAQLPELEIGRLIVHDAPKLLYLRAVSKESAIPFAEISLSDLPMLRSLTLYTPPPEKQPLRCRLKTDGVFPKLVQYQIFHASTDQESLARLNDSPILRGGELDDVQVDSKTE